MYSIIAFFLVYLFGGSVFLLSLIPLLYMRMILFYLSWKDEWERFAALCIIIVTTSCLFSFYGCYNEISVYSGGIIGLLVLRWLTSITDQTSVLVILWTMLSASLIVMLRFFYMPVVRVISRLLSAIGYYLVTYKVAERVASFGVFIFCSCIMYPCVAFVSFTRSLFEGSAFDGTGLLNPTSEIQEEEHVAIQDNLTTPCFYELSQEGKETAQNIPAQETHKIKAETEKKKKLFFEHSYTINTRTIFGYSKTHYDTTDTQDMLNERARTLQNKLERFGIKGAVVAIKAGPVVTLFEYAPEPDTKLSKILSLEDDLAMALQAMSIRILAPIPGKAVVGFEVANTQRVPVSFASLILDKEFHNFAGHLPLILGRSTTGDPVIVDLAKMPHLLIAGSTGSGKSVGLTSLLLSLLLHSSPRNLRLILIDPKRLEFSSFADIGHLIFPIITQPSQAVLALRWVVNEMERRYEKMAEKSVRSVYDYNASCARDNNQETFPFIVVMIDELADLMMTSGKDVEDLITRIAQMARAAGIHLIVATQRPSVDVVTGLIKANFPSRISFRVASRIDSRTILDCMGADRLLGKGDMLFLDACVSHIVRVHGAYVSDEEIKKVITSVRAQTSVEYLDINMVVSDNEECVTDDPLYEEIIMFVKNLEEVSISLIQRRFRIGYNRSARIVDALEAQGIIMPHFGGKMRKVIR